MRSSAVADLMTLVAFCDFKGLLQHHSRHARHKQRQQHSRLAGRQHRQQDEEPQHSQGSIFGAGGLLSGLFRSKGSSTSGQHDNPADAAAATADLLESGHSLTFSARSQSAAAAASAAGAASPTAADPTSSSGLEQYHSISAEGVLEGDRTSRCISEPVLPMSRGQSASSEVRSGQLNEQVFNGSLGGVTGVTSVGPQRGSQSISLGQLSQGKRRWQNAAQKVIAMHQITSTFRPGALQVGIVMHVRHMLPAGY